MPSPKSGAILAVSGAFMASRTLLAAVELGVFTALGRRALSGSALAEILGLHPRAALDFFDALVALGFLLRDGDPVGLYSNTLDTAAYLDMRSPEYLGGWLEMLSKRTYKFWTDLPAALTSGAPQNEVKHFGRPLFDILCEHPGKLRGFLGGMSGFASSYSSVFAAKFDWTDYASYVDVGGAAGVLAMAVARANSRLRVYTYDLPAVSDVAEEALATAGMSQSVAVLRGSFLTDPLPKCDVISMSHILHDWWAHSRSSSTFRLQLVLFWLFYDLRELGAACSLITSFTWLLCVTVLSVCRNLAVKKQLIAAAYAALPPGGAFVVIECFVDDDRRQPTGLLSSLNMLIEVGDAFDFSPADLRRWCEPIGFTGFHELKLTGKQSAVVAYKLPLRTHAPVSKL